VKQCGVDTVEHTSDMALDTFRRRVVEIDYPPGPFFEHHHIIFTVDMEERGGKGRCEQGFADWTQRDERPHAYPVLTGCNPIFCQSPIQNQRGRRGNIQSWVNRPSIDEERFVQVRLLKLEFWMISDLSAWMCREPTIIETMRAIAAP